VPPRRGSAAGGNFGSALLQPSRTLCVYGGTAACAQCLRLSERFFIKYELRFVAFIRPNIFFTYHCACGS